jgi:hypothetical protein
MFTYRDCVTAVDGGGVLGRVCKVQVTVAKRRSSVEGTRGGGPGESEGPHDGAVQGHAPGGKSDLIDCPRARCL